MGFFRGFYRVVFEFQGFRVPFGFFWVSGFLGFLGSFQGFFSFGCTHG
jgi:hypothetical protein